ncbi:Smr/MutS family protein [Telmatospirillum sp.]|uniref:Smr/MutS family protein n=1 Tax=Telmatospirillum sp. TaxID=2079197 RepID=UPI002843FA28|nr:Smr/MutS family protein [Telmatospirillum sp.]MDR3439617.1 Smr/MutS family protein [Telmatospirillum sp.]
MSDDWRRRRVVTAEEAELWRQAMRGTKVFAHHVPAEAAPVLSPPPPSPPLPAKKKRLAIPTTPLAAEPPPRTIVPVSRPAVPTLDYRRSPGLDKSTAGRFTKGAMAIDAVLDLHGLTQPVAHAALGRFITGSADLGRRCLLVVTGKGNGQGTGVLRAEVPRWLNEPGLRAQILAFTYAQPKDGGSGALYVLLKRRR